MSAERDFKLTAEEMGVSPIRPAYQSMASSCSTIFDNVAKNGSMTFTNGFGVSGLSRQEQNQICSSVENAGYALKNTVSEGMKCEAPKAAGGSFVELLGAGAKLAHECMAKLNPANKPDAPQVRQATATPVMTLPSPGMAA